MTDDLAARVSDLIPGVVDDLTALVAIPSVSSLPDRHADVDRTVEAVSALLSDLHCPDVQVVREGGQPAIIGVIYDEFDVGRGIEREFVVEATGLGGGASATTAGGRLGVTMPRTMKANPMAAIAATASMAMRTALMVVYSSLPQAGVLAGGPAIRWRARFEMPAFCKPDLFAARIVNAD